jgi:hypothetical protein
MPNRIYDDLVDKSINFNLALVNRVFLSDNDAIKQTSEKNQSQMIEIKPFSTTLPTIQRKLNARPLLRGISDSITRGDLVLFTIISKKIYYIGPLNTLNTPQLSPANFYNKQIESRNSTDLNLINETGYGRDYPYLSGVKKLQKIKNNQLDFFEEEYYDVSKLSDLTLEGRHGNSIRLGSRAIFPNVSIANNNLGGETLFNGSNISMLSNGSIQQNFQTDNNFLLSIDTPIEENETNAFPLNKGNDLDEEKFDYNYGLEQDTDSKNDFDQIIITSDKITFDARSTVGGDFTVSSNRNINFGARKNFTLNNSGNSVINSRNIYLGEPAKNKSEPLVLGEQLRVLLLEIMNILQDSRALVQGVPIPFVNQNSSPMFQRIQNLITELQPRTETEGELQNDGPEFMSHHHYIETNIRSQNEG